MRQLLPLKYLVFKKGRRESMKFIVNDKTYLLEFTHQFQEVKVQRGQAVLRTKSTYPATTAFIREVVAGKPRDVWPVRFSATVGCLPSDPYSKQAGNHWALKKLTAHLCSTGNKQVINPMWQAYSNRFEESRRQREAAAKRKLEQSLLAAQ